MKNHFLQVAKVQIADYLVLCLIAGSWLPVITVWMLSNCLTVAF